MAHTVLPDVAEADAAPFWQAAQRGILTVQRCVACSKLRFPPRPFCVCGSDESSWVEMSGRARLWSWCVSHGPTLAAFQGSVPFVIALVELLEDPAVRMVGNLVVADGAGINEVDPATLSLGLPLRVAFASVAEGVSLPLWVPTGAVYA